MNSKKFTSTVAGASIFITLTLLVGRGLGLFREAVFANYFGLSEQYDLFLIAAVLPVTISTILLFVGQNFFIPGFNTYKNISEENANDFTRLSFWVFLAGGIVIGLLLAIFAGDFLSIYLRNNSVSELAVEVLQIMSGTLPFAAGCAIFSAYLQANFEFRYPALSQLLLNVSVIIIVLIFQHDFGVKAIAYGYLAGNIIQFVVLWIIVQKNVNLISKNIFYKTGYLKIVNTSLLTIIIIEILGQLYPLADRFFYSSIDKGGIAALNYAFNLYTIPISIISLAITTAIFPSISQTTSDNNNKLEAQIKNFMSVNIFLFVPITFILYFFGGIILQILFERGAFTSADTKHTAELLKIYSLSLIFYSTYAIVNKVFYSKKIVTQLLIISLIVIAIKIICNFLLVKELKQNGLAVSTAISLISYFVVSHSYLVRKINLEEKMIFIRELIMSVLNCVISYFTSKQLITISIDFTFVGATIIHIILFLSIYLLNSHLLKLSSENIISRSFVRLVR